MMFSKSFKEGFVGGLNSPYDVLDRKHTNPDKFHVSIDEAWEEVGKTLKYVIRVESSTLGKISVKSFPTHQRSHHTRKRAHGG